MITQSATETSPLIIDLVQLSEVKEVRFDVGLKTRRELSKQLSGDILELRFGLTPEADGLVLASSPSRDAKVVVTIQMKRVKIGPVRAVDTTVSFAVVDGLRTRCWDKQQINRMGKLSNVGDVVRLATDEVIQRVICKELPGFATDALTLLVGGDLWL
jgi:hypothetical protein